MSKVIIKDIKAGEIIDNRGMPTVRSYAYVNDVVAWADAPKGSSTGSFEAFDLRDGGKRYNGMGVQKAVKNIEDIIAPALRNREVASLNKIDRIMLDLDGTENKSKLGGNAVTATSLAVAKAAAKALGLPLYNYLNPFAHVLPVPQACFINGGVHADNGIETQEMCVMPVGVNSFAEAMEVLNAVWFSLKEVLRKNLGEGASNTGEDGGFAPSINDLHQAMDYMMEAVRIAECEDIILYGFDMAASGYYRKSDKTYSFQGKERTREEMIDYYDDFLKKYPALVSIEDPLDENDVEGWSILTQKFQDRILIIGDDFFSTNIGRLKIGVKNNAANALLCKVNQIGSISETFEAARFAERNNMSVVMSPRSGETEDDILSDISVALNAGCYKTGGMRGSDRGSNYNRFLEIEKELGSSAVYAGADYSRKSNN